MKRISRLAIAISIASPLGLTAAVTSANAQIPASEFVARRDSLAARVGNGVVLAFGAPTLTNDFGPFFQFPAFHYLTGYHFADATLVMVVRNGRATNTLYYNRSAPRRALYYGDEPDSAEIGRETGLVAQQLSGFADAVEKLADGSLPFFTLRDIEDADFAGADSLTRGGQFVKALAVRHPKLVIKDGHPLVSELRARKSTAELALIRKAAEISAEGHRTLMQNVRPGMKEYEMAATIEYTFRRLGAERPAYGSIVGAGPNGTQLHYMKDSREAKAGEVVVVDAAGEYHGYAADITRTIPVSGTFTQEQKDIYQIVRDAQAAAERNSKPGLSMAAAQDSSVEVRARGLAKLGLIESATATLDMPWPTNCEANVWNCRQVSLFNIHGISHGIGLAVHDPVQASFGNKTFKQGDAFTIEPGIYINSKLLEILPDTPKNRAFKAKVKALVEKYKDTGVRIEDDYVITDKGLEWITKAVPREIPEIEALMKRKGPGIVP